MSQDDQGQMPEIKPEIVFIFELVRDVEMGKVRIPNFQRDFVWRRGQMTDLLDSIRRQFPIGSLLVWETDTKLSSKEWVGPVHVPQAQQGLAGFVLDGQQRLSTLVGVLREPKKDEVYREDDKDPARWRVLFNADKDVFEHSRNGEAMKAYHLPMWSIMDTIGFINECQRMMKDGGADGQRYVERAQSLARSFQGYKMPIIRIRNTELNKAVEIFARLNTKGQSITADQMVAALTYAEGSSGEDSFNLAKAIDELIDQADLYDFGEIERTVVLRGCLAVLGEDVYNTDWTKMRDTKKDNLKGKFPKIIEETGKALKQALNFLNENLITTNRLLPYSMQLVILIAFFHRCPKPTSKQKLFLRRWIWVSSFTGFFASGNPSRTEALIKEFRDVVPGKKDPSTLVNMNMLEPAQPFPKTFDMRSARARCFLNVLLSLNPCDDNGELIPEPWKMIREHGPNALGRIFAIAKGRILESSPANRFIRFNVRDRAQGKNWMRALSSLEEEMRNKILRSHGIPPEAFDDLFNNRAEEFLRKRLDYLIQLDLTFMEQEGVVRPSSLVPQNAPIDTE